MSDIVAHWVERLCRKWKVPGSNPTLGKNFSFCFSRLICFLQLEQAHANEINHPVLDNFSVEKYGGSFPLFITFMSALKNGQTDDQTAKLAEKHISSNCRQFT